ncbi:MAG: Circadian clock protein KaiB [Chroococcopsis gigantea SAG 12.99]|jgi:circadian clock protein KaiB|nr:circadian clock KaiB family protein [Chlorogloea purpurea SAG 13.99]MDV3001260.1 Circadian clock protein KaiB [Chroococcopsis gigantea SAG 12.99]
MTNSVTLPPLFKGIALFTPGGDLIYGIDPHKGSQWHLNLCAALQDTLGLVEPPHFLVPGYTATVDRWRDQSTQKVITIAELYPAVQRYQSLLDLLFGIDDRVWKVAPWQDEYCSPILLESYRTKFPQLWESHDLIIRYSPKDAQMERINELSASINNNPQSYILRLFVSGNNASTKHTLEAIHQILEQELRHPYTLKVIDVSQHPDQAESNHVSAIPTLVRVWPEPVKRIVGEFEDLSRVLQIIAN